MLLGLSHIGMLKSEPVSILLILFLIGFQYMVSCDVWCRWVNDWSDATHDAYAYWILMLFWLHALTAVISYLCDKEILHYPAIAGTELSVGNAMSTGHWTSERCDEVVTAFILNDCCMEVHELWANNAVWKVMSRTGMQDSACFRSYWLSRHTSRSLLHVPLMPTGEGSYWWL